MSYKIGQVTTARLADDCITSAKLSVDSVLSANIADDQILAASIATDAIISDGIQANAVGASELADSSVDSAAIANGAVTSAKLEDNVSVAGNLVVAGNLSVTGNASEIHLEELKIDEATMTLNREDSTTYSALVAAGDIGLIVKGGTDEDVKMVFDKNGSNPRVNFKDESGDFIEVKGGAGTFTGDLSAVGLNASGSVALGGGPNTFQFNVNNGAVSASGAITATGGFVGDVTGDVSGSSGTCTGLAGSATVLATARTIAGQSFDGSANIAVASTDLSDAASFNAPTATSAAAWTTARTITLGGDLSGSVSLDGSANVTLTASIDSIGEVVALGTDTTGNYLQSLACSDDAITVANGSAEGGAATLTLSSHLEGIHDAVAGTNSGGGPGGGESYLVQHGQMGATAALMGNGFKALIYASDSSGIRNTAGMGTGAYGDLKTSGDRLIESVMFTRPGATSGSNQFTNTATGNLYKSCYVLDATAATSAVTFSLPLLHASDDGGSSKIPLGACMKIKLSAIGAGGSIVLSKPSGAAAASKIDGADTFTLNEANQAVTIFAGQDANSVMQYFIV